MSRRFNLDPRAPSRAPPPPPAPKAPAGAPTAPARPASSAAARPFSAPPSTAKPAGPSSTPTPASAPGAPAASAAEGAAAPARSRRTMWILAAVVALVVVGGGIAAYAATALKYPNAYLLEDADERPSGITVRQLTRGQMDGLGITENPGEMDKEAFDSFTQGAIRHEPEEVHAHALQGSAGDQIFVFAVKFANEQEARESSQDQTARVACTGRTGRTVTLLRDSDVVVAIFSEGPTQNAHVNVVRALLAQNDDLAPECGPR